MYLAAANIFCRQKIIFQENIEKVLNTFAASIRLCHTWRLG